jgi:hypothetical protein
MESKTNTYRGFSYFGDKTLWKFEVVDTFRNKILLCLCRNGPRVRFFPWHGSSKSGVKVAEKPVLPFLEISFNVVLFYQ